MKTLQIIWQKIAPNGLVVFIRFLCEPQLYKIRRKAVLKFYKKNGENEPVEIKEGLKFLKYHKFTPFPFKWTKKYEKLLPEVFRDETEQRFYVLFENKKLYYPQQFTKMMAVWGTRSILKEQDPLSPHLYLTPNFKIEPDSIIIDAGVAEGNFALSVVEKAKKLYLIECDPNWLATLKVTFAPWKEKVVFVEKYLSDINDETNITIDQLIQPDPKENYFVKMDIEGFEKKALAGMQKLISSAKFLKMNICTYHHPNDLSEIESIIRNYGFKWEVSNGYILYFQPGDDPTFRKALIRAEKQ